MTSVDFQNNAELASPVELDFEQSSQYVATPRRDPDLELLRHGGQRTSHTAEVRDDVPDSRRRVSLKLDHQTKSFSVDEDDDDDGGEEKPAVEPPVTDESAEAEKPLSSGWAAALAAASAAGSIRAAAKRRPNVGRANTFVPPPTRSLFCLSLTNPLRKLTISVVEWKYPFCIDNFLIKADFYYIKYNTR